MRIAHIIDTLDPKQGGPQMVSLRVAAGQAALGHDVMIMTSTDAAAMPRIDAEYARVPGADRVERPIVPDVQNSPVAGSTFWNRKAAAAIEALLRRVDVAHVHSVWCGISALSTAVARRVNVPYVIQPHGQLDPWSLGRSRWKKRIAMAVGARRMLDEAGGLLLLNADEKTGIAPLQLRSREQRVIPNGVYLSEIDPLPLRDTFREKHRGFLHDHPFVLFLSRLHVKKGLDILAAAFEQVAKELPDVRLVVVGPEDGAGDAFKADIARAGLSSRVLMPGPLYGREKLEALRSASVFCLPSRQEGFSIAILEAMACECPCVITHACHFPEVELAGAGYAVAVDPSAVAGALLRVLRASESDISTMRQAARRLVADNYTWDIVARQTLDLYQAVCSIGTTSRA